MKITKEILRSLKETAELQRNQALGSLNACNGQIHLLDEQLKLLEQPEPKSPSPRRAAPRA